jgi:hypothetical protein
MWYESLSATTHGEARREYERLYRQGVQRQWIEALFGRPSRLMELDGVRRQANVRNASYGGMRTVPIESIRGTEGRSLDFDAAFRPLQMHQCERWASIAECRSKDVPLPAVNLIQVGDTYFVRDGHHRISVAKVRGQLDIEAEVTVWQNARLPEVENMLVESKQPMMGAWQLPAVANRMWGRAVTMLADTRRRLMDGIPLSPQSES